MRKRRPMGRRKAKKQFSRAANRQHRSNDWRPSRGGIMK